MVGKSRCPRALLQEHDVRLVVAVEIEERSADNKAARAAQPESAVEIESRTARRLPGKRLADGRIDGEAAARRLTAARRDDRLLDCKIAARLRRRRDR